jgi:NADPH2:quinone reductase
LFARHKGINLINLVRRSEQVEELKKEFGQDTHVVVYDGNNSDEALKQINEITNKRGVNFGIDAVAGTTNELITKVLAPLGKVLVYGVLNGIDLKLNAGEMLFKEFSVQGFWLSPWLRRNTTETRQRVYDEVMTLMSKKIITPFVEARYPFTEYIAAINHSMQKGKSGKVLLEWK